MTESKFELEKAINRFKELESKPFKKISDKVITEQKIVNELKEDLAEEMIQPIKNNAKIQLLEARILQRQRNLNELITKEKL